MVFELLAGLVGLGLSIVMFVAALPTKDGTVKAFVRSDLRQATYAIVLLALILSSIVMLTDGLSKTMA